MAGIEHVYTLYMRATPKQVWDALTNPEFARQYWGGYENVSDWKKGSKWYHAKNGDPDTKIIVGKVVDSVPPETLILTWADPDEPDSGAAYSRVTFRIEPIEDMVRLTVTHSELEPDMAREINIGWPRVLSSLKSFLETGKPLNVWAGM